jgi:ribonuclease R
MKHQPGRPFKPRSLFKKLGVPENQYKPIKGILEELFRDGKIYRRGKNLYSYRASGGHVIGRLLVTQRGFGFVEVEGRDTDLFVRERNMRNALHGDTVRVEVFKKGGDTREEARIAEVVQRGRTEFVGVFGADRHGEWFIPDDQRIRVRFMVKTVSAPDARPGQVVSVELLHWYDSDPEPVCRVIEVLGNPGDPGLDLLKIIRQFELPTEWDEAALKQARAFSEADIAREAENRLDLREVECFTIDPDDAKDYDDAVSLEKNGQGWRLGVHIADVSHYVTPGTVLDAGARERATSVYLVGSAVHMLPEELAGDLCSLVPQRDRLSMSCIMDLAANGDVRKVKIAPSIINSNRRYTYREVQAVIDGAQDENSESIQNMNKLHLILRKSRKDAGSIDLDIPEPVFTLNADGLPTEIHASQRTASNMLIEEFMLLANRCVAEYLKEREEKQNWPGLYRIHAAPQPDDLKAFRRILEQLGIHTHQRPTMTPKDLQAIVEQVRESPFRYFIERLALRSMTKARYAVQNVGHFGLAFEWYTHFTSPIRRYPDLQVHRLLKQYLRPAKGVKPPNPDRLQELAVHCSRREERAVSAERAHLKIKQLQYLAQHVGEDFSGIISGVIGVGFFVELADTLVEGFVHLSTLGDDWYEFQEQDYALVGRRTRKVLRLGDVVRIKVSSVSVEEGFADFSLTEFPASDKKST